MKKEISSLSLQLDYIKRILKSRNVEISWDPSEEWKCSWCCSEGDEKVDPQLCEEGIESARQLVKKANKEEMIKGSILVRFKSINKINYI